MWKYILFIPLMIYSEITYLTPVSRGSVLALWWFKNEELPIDWWPWTISALKQRLSDVKCLATLQTDQSNTSLFRRQWQEVMLNLTSSVTFTLIRPHFNDTALGYKPNFLLSAVLEEETQVKSSTSVLTMSSYNLNKMHLTDFIHSIIFSELYLPNASHYFKQGKKI